MRSFSGSHFPLFGLNTEIYTVNIQGLSNESQIQTRETPYLVTFPGHCKIRNVELPGKQPESDVLEQLQINVWLEDLGMQSNFFAFNSVQVDNFAC